MPNNKPKQMSAFTYDLLIRLKLLAIVDFQHRLRDVYNRRHWYKKCYKWTHWAHKWVTEKNIKSKIKILRELELDMKKMRDEYNEVHNN